MKRYLIIRRTVLLTALCLAATLVTVSCGTSGGTGANTLGGGVDLGGVSVTLPPSGDVTLPQGVDINNTYIAGTVSVDYSAFDLDDDESGDALTVIRLADGATTVEGAGAGYSGGVLTVTAGGVYYLTGTLNGKIVVNAPETDKVKLVLAGVEIICSDDSAVYAESADKLLICLASGTENSIRDTDTRIESDSDTRGNAAIYACCSLTFNGSGKLTVSSSYKHGIASKKNIRIVSGDIAVTATDVGIKGNNSVAVAGGTVTVSSASDGIKTEETEDTEKGFVLIEGGTLNITAKGDGIAGSLYTVIKGGEINIVTTGSVSGGSTGGGWWGGSSATSTGTSSKGIKAEVSLQISGGTVNDSSTGHALHSADEIIISGTTDLTLSSSSGKGISGHGNVTLAGGYVTVKKATEGIESKAVLNISGGIIRLEACSDDGLNAGGGGGMGGGMFGGFSSSASGTHEIYITGGYLYLNASGDGIDSNGNISMSGGTVIVAGPTNNGNGALDKGDGNYSITVTGGTLIAYGSSGMAETPGTTSGQCSLSITLSGMSAGKLCYICDSDGNPVIAFEGGKSWSNVVISSPLLVKGKTYTVYTGGSATCGEGGGISDGYYSGSFTCSGGTSAGTVTLNSVTASLGNGGGSSGGPGGFSGGQRPGGR